MTDYCGPSEKYLNRYTPGGDVFNDACRQHDTDYLQGVDRLEADVAFKRRMLSAASSLRLRALALTYYALVRAFGWIFYPGRGQE